MSRGGTGVGSWARIAFGAAVLANLVVLYWPRSVSAGGIAYGDKVVHMAIFALVAATGLWARVPLAWLVGLLVVHAISSELVQHWFLVNRSGDLADVVADLVGVALGVLIGLKLSAVRAATSARSGGSLSA